MLNGTTPKIQHRKWGAESEVMQLTCCYSTFWFYKLLHIYFSFKRKETLENIFNDDDQKDEDKYKVYDDIFKLAFGFNIEKFEYIVVRHNSMVVPMIATTFGWICFKLWSLNVARKARKEILNSECLPATYQRGHGSNHEMAMGLKNVSGANRGM